MNEQTVDHRESLKGLAQGDATKLGFLQSVIENSFKESGLDPQTFMLVRMAALSGRLADQCALIGVLNSLHDIGCPILSVEYTGAG